MKREQILQVLRAQWLADFEAAELEAGVAYLLKRRIVTEADGVIAPRVTSNGAAATVVRNPVDQTELIVVVPNGKPQ